jgi:hypothetical protein
LKAWIFCARKLGKEVRGRNRKIAVCGKILFSGEFLIGGIQLRDIGCAPPREDRRL